MPADNAWQNRIIAHGEKPASDFLAHELQWKIHPKFQQDAIEGNLDQVGWFKSVTESARTGKLLDGHARIMIALRHGDDMPVPYEVVDVSEEEERIILATIDPLVGLAATDKELLDGLLRELPPMDVRLQEMVGKLAADAGLYKVDPTAEWQGMPEFEQDGIKPFQTLIIHFKTMDDRNEFSKLLNQKITDKTKSFWFPERPEELQNQLGKGFIISENES